MAIAQRSIRLLGKKTLELNRQSASSGEIFYDTDAQTLRIWANSTSSTILATRTWVTANSPQSDWNQATTTAADFIKNKPTIPTNTNQLTNGAGFITATGIPAQTGNSGKYLTTNGTAVSWATVTATVTASDVGLGNVTNESKATMFSSPTFTGTVSGVTATHVGLGNVTNESKATMFSSPAFTGTVTSAGNINFNDSFGVVIGTTPKSKVFYNASYNQFINIASSTGVLFNDTDLYIKANSVDVLRVTSSKIYTVAPLQFTGSSSGSVSFQAGATPAIQTYTLPAAYPAANGYALVSTTGGTLSWASAGGGSGTVTSVAMSVPSFLSVSGSPITSSGTFSLGLSQSPTNGQLLIGTGGSGFNYANLTAGANVTITNSSGGITIASSGGASGITWTANTSPSGTITVTNPTGYDVSGSTMVIVVVGLSVSSSMASSGSGSFSTAMSVGQNTRVFYTYTTSSLGTTTTISSITGYAMAYAYIGSGPSIATTSTSTSATSTTVMNPSPVYGTPRIIAVSQSSSLNLATLAGPATGGGPTWATGSGFVHPNDSQLSAAVWVGTGSWTTMATPTITSNPSFMSWYLTGISIS